MLDHKARVIASNYGLSGDVSLGLGIAPPSFWCSKVDADFSVKHLAEPALRWLKESGRWTQERETCLLDQAAEWVGAVRCQGDIYEWVHNAISTLDSEEVVEIRDAHRVLTELIYRVPQKPLNRGLRVVTKRIPSPEERDLDSALDDPAPEGAT